MTSSAMDKKYNFVCRVCLVKNPLIVMRSLAEAHTREILYECTSVWVEPKDKYPQQICGKCWNRCRSWSDFKAIAQESERQLRMGSNKEQDDEHMEVADHGEFIADYEEDAMKENGSMGPVKKEEPETEGEELADYDPLPGNAKKRRYEKRKRPSPTSIDQSAEIIERVYECQQCLKTFPTLGRLNKHIRTHMDDRTFECDECDKNFQTKWHLASHKNSHTDVKPFQCDQCEKKFKRLPDMNKHRTNKHS